MRCFPAIRAGGGKLRGILNVDALAAHRAGDGGVVHLDQIGRLIIALAKHRMLQRLHIAGGGIVEHTQHERRACAARGFQLADGHVKALCGQGKWICILAGYGIMVDAEPATPFVGSCAANDTLARAYFRAVGGTAGSRGAPVNWLALGEIILVLCHRLDYGHLYYGEPGKPSASTSHISKFAAPWIDLKDISHAARDPFSLRARIFALLLSETA